MEKQIDSYEVGQIAAAHGVSVSSNPFYQGFIDWIHFANGHEDYLLRHYHF